MRGRRTALAVVVATLAIVLLASVGLRRSGADPAAAAAALDQALALDAQLEGADDPAALQARRDRAFAGAAAAYQTLLRRRPASPEAHLGLAKVAWVGDQDLARARRHVDQAVAALERLSPRDRAALRAGGRSGNELLAEAYAERASFRLMAAPDAVAPPTPADLDAAAADVQRALALDEQRDYQLLATMIERLRQAAAEPMAPVSPESLQVR